MVMVPAPPRWPSASPTNSSPASIAMTAPVAESSPALAGAAGPATPIPAARTVSRILRIGKVWPGLRDVPCAGTHTLESVAGAADFSAAHACARRNLQGNALTAGFVQEDVLGDTGWRPHLVDGGGRYPAQRGERQYEQQPAYPQDSHIAPLDAAAI